MSPEKFRNRERNAVGVRLCPRCRHLLTLAPNEMKNRAFRKLSNFCPSAHKIEEEEVKTFASRKSASIRHQSWVISVKKSSRWKNIFWQANERVESVAFQFSLVAPMKYFVVFFPEHFFTTRRHFLARPAKAKRARTTMRWKRGETERGQNQTRGNFPPLIMQSYCVNILQRNTR